MRLQGRPGRRAARWFSFDLPVESAHPASLVVTYNRDEWRQRTFDILIDGALLKSVTIERRGPLRFFDAEYSIPARLVEGKKQITVRFQATGGNETAAVYGIRMIRGDRKPAN